MKKKLVAMACVAAMTASAVPAFGAESVKVLVNNAAVTFTGQQPVIQDGSTLIPVRGALEAMGVAVVWEEATKSVKLNKEDKNATLVIGEKSFLAGTEKKDLSAPAQMIGGSTMIPLRAVAEFFGGEVTWEDATKTVTVVMEATTEPLPEVKPEEKPEEKPVVKSEMFETASYTAQLKGADGTVLLDAKAEYPKFTEKAAGAKTAELNKKIEADMKAQVDAVLAENKDSITEEAKDLGAEFRAKEYVVGFEAPFADGKVISYLSNAYLFMGGAHGNTKAEAFTYNVETGKEAVVADFVKLDANVKEDAYLKSVVLDDMKANKAAYLEGAEKTLNDTKDLLGFYLNEKGEFVVFVSETTAVKPYSDGIVKIVKELK